MNLRLGHDVVVDAVNDSEAARQTWRNAVEATDADLLSIHLVISDTEEHKRRLLGRGRRYTHVPEPDWDQVQARRDIYAPWHDAHVELDTATRSVIETAHEIVRVTAAASRSSVRGGTA